MQNLDLKAQADNAKTAKDYIDYVLKQLVTDYQKTKEERRKLALWEESQEFTILGIIEMFTTDIRGYTFQILDNSSLGNSQNILNNLQRIKMFNIPYFGDWYFDAASDYPLIKQYIETLNYLRLLLIEYLNEITTERKGEK